MSRAKSPNDFINKTAIVIEEADESLYWLEIIKGANLVEENNLKVDDLIKEANELTAIFVSISKNQKQKKQTNN